MPNLRTGTSLKNGWFSSSTPRDGRISYYEALSRSAPAVVNIYTRSIINSQGLFGQQTRERTDLGSGVIMTDSGYLLTCYHVVANADNISVVLQDSRVFEAQMIGFDRATDLAVLKINSNDLPTIPQVESTDLRIGDTVMAIGNPFNLGQTVTHGIVSSPGRIGLWNFVDFIQTDAVLNNGNSGGALVDSNGILVGITNANYQISDRNGRLQNVDGINFAVPYEVAANVMEKIITNGRVIRGQLGFSGEAFPNRPGIVVTAVAQNGPAYMAGLRPDDIVLAIDGVRLESASEALNMIAETPPGTQLELEISRENDLINIIAQVTEAEV
ncbi:trypsin-like peptidase domain-containing protein [Alteromonas sp. 5E99-2]|uniref:trypsin-like peptidase domain-containing protein n=1 Tax=Alteromonas sp. 5E99-2 TaxID=2817683 RepID=UPI001A988F94|nr:trypsin-like peptidase domain-containing protein [Alteromonas sp. 5E99-2]MBO1254286.1 trypsin-like peptidase domain-containing protein [Alteromonas sp. 5E99-2]